jgi:hypothetical protein
MFLRRETVAPGGGGAPAAALRTLLSGSAPSPARPPAITPDRRKKDLRSRPPCDSRAIAGLAVPRRCLPSVLLMSTASLHRIAVDPVKRLNFRRVRLILRSEFVAPHLGRSGTRCGAHRDRGAGNRHREKQVTTTNQSFALLVHGIPSINSPSQMMHSPGKRKCRTASANIQHPPAISQWNMQKKCTATDGVQLRSMS